MMPHGTRIAYNIMVGWLCLAPHRQRGHLETAPHLLSPAKDVKLGLYTVPTGNRTPGRRVAVYYTTTAPRQLHFSYNIIIINLTYLHIGLRARFQQNMID